tara:strand:+ start:50 stop:238 length:189 start_codon:yes stop_codon:yes gene_type:complete
MTGKELEGKLSNLKEALKKATEEQMQLTIRKTKLEGAIELLDILIAESAQKAEPKRSGKKKK